MWNNDVLRYFADFLAVSAIASELTSALEIIHAGANRLACARIFVEDACCNPITSPKFIKVGWILVHNKKSRFFGRIIVLFKEVCGYMFVYQVLLLCLASVQKINALYDV